MNLGQKQILEMFDAQFEICFLRSIFMSENMTFWVVTKCSSSVVHRRFRRTYHLHLKGRRTDWRQPLGTAVNTVVVSHLFLAGFSHVLVFDPEEGDDTFLRNVCGPLQNYILHNCCCYNLNSIILMLLSRVRVLRVTYKTGSGFDDWIY
jgi:hypothetical protein